MRCMLLLLLRAAAAHHRCWRQDARLLCIRLLHGSSRPLVLERLVHSIEAVPGDVAVDRMQLVFGCLHAADSGMEMPMRGCDGRERYRRGDSLVLVCGILFAHRCCFGDVCHIVRGKLLVHSIGQDLSPVCLIGKRADPLLERLLVSFRELRLFRRCTL